MCGKMSNSGVDVLLVSSRQLLRKSFVDIYTILSINTINSCTVEHHKGHR